MYAGNAALDIWDLVDAGLVEQTGITVFADGGSNADDLCIFHGTFTLADLQAIGDGSGALGSTDSSDLVDITDIVYLSSGVTGESVSVTATVTE